MSRGFISCKLTERLEGSYDLHPYLHLFPLSATEVRGNFMSLSFLKSHGAFVLLQTISDTNIYLKKKKKE
jgi:hypothetical protein